MCFNSQSSGKPSLSPEFLQPEGHRPAVASVGSWQWFPLARGHQCFQSAKLQRDAQCTRSGRKMTRVCSGCIKISSLNNNETGSVLSPWFSCWSGQEPACMERGGKQVLYTKHPCSAALWAVALCSARRVQSPLSIASVKLAAGRHSSAFIQGRTGKCSQALHCWMGSWRHGNTSWPYWSQWQGSHGFQPCQYFIYWGQRGEELWIATPLRKICIFCWKKS